MVKRKFAVFDIDGTLVRWQLYHAIADNLVKLGYIDSESFQQIKDARMEWKRRTHSESFRDYELRLVQLFTDIMLKLTAEQFKEAAGAVFEEYKDQVYTYTRDLIKSLQAANYLIFAVSGSQEEVVKSIAGYYGFDDFIGRVDEQKNERFTGKSTTPVFHKDVAVKDLIEKHHAELSDSYAVGDSHSDIAMMELVENPIAFNPERRLFNYAKKRRWQIVIERKNMVYYLKPNQKGYILAETDHE